MMDRVIVVAGVPRSGTSWLGQIIDSSPDVAYRFQPLFSYAFKDAVNINSTREEFAQFFNDIYESDDEFLLQTDKRKAGVYPTFDKVDTPSILAFKTCRYQYLLPKMLRWFPDLKLLGIVRHPCGVINSWLRNPVEFPESADPAEEWRFGACKNQGREEEFFGYYKWKEVAHLYLDLRQKYPNRVRIVEYEQLVDRPEKVTRVIFGFVGLRFSRQTALFLDASHSVHREGPYTVFKDKSVKDRWRHELDQSIVLEIFQDLAGTRLEEFVA